MVNENEQKLTKINENWITLYELDDNAWKWMTLEEMGKSWWHLIKMDDVGWYGWLDELGEN